MANKENKHTIWSSDINLEDWKDFLKEEYPDSSEDEYYDLAAELNSEYLEDERMNLNINVPDKIICIADLGLWNGRRSGYKIMNTRNIADCLYSDCDYVDWYCDEYGDFRCDASHHDGTNHLLYRMFKPTVSEERRVRLLDLIYEGKASKQDIAAVTVRLGDYIGKVYGWTFKGRKVQVAA